MKIRWAFLQWSQTGAVVAQIIELPGMSRGACKFHIATVFCWPFEGNAIGEATELLEGQVVDLPCVREYPQSETLEGEPYEQDQPAETLEGMAS